jgi:hypothetical protein
VNFIRIRNDYSGSGLRIRIRQKVSDLTGSRSATLPNWICIRVVPVFQFWIFEKTIKVLSRFIQRWIQPPAYSDHGLYRNLASYWLAHFFLMKNPPKWCTMLVCIAWCWNSLSILLTNHNSKNNSWFSRIFGAQFGGKDRGLRPIPPVCRINRRIRGHFCMKRLRIFEVFANILN